MQVFGLSKEVEILLGRVNIRRSRIDELGRASGIDIQELIIRQRDHELPKGIRLHVWIIGFNLLGKGQVRQNHGSAATG